MLAENAIDQFVMNEMLQDMMKTYGWGVARPLDRFLYPTGLIFHLNRMNQKLGIVPMVVHMNWLVGNADKKVQLRNHGLWFVGEAFAEYTSP